MRVGPQDTVLVPLGSRVLCVGVVAVAATVGVTLVARGDTGVLLQALPALALVVALSVILFWLPRVSVTPSEIEVVNPFRTYRITWPAVREVGTKWAMTLYTDGGRIEAWAAPAPGPLTGGQGRRDRRAPGAAQIVRSQWEAYRDADLLGSIEGAGVARSWHPVRIGLTAALAVLTVLALALP